MTPQRRRRLALALGGVAALLAVALAGALALRLPLAEWLVLAQLASRGASPGALRVTRLDLRGMALSDLVIGATGITLSNGVFHAADAVALQAKNDLGTAYTTLAAVLGGTDLSGTDLGSFDVSNPLSPGVYRFTSEAQLT